MAAWPESGGRFCRSPIAARASRRSMRSGSSSRSSRAPRTAPGWACFWRVNSARPTVPPCCMSRAKAGVASSASCLRTRADGARTSFKIVVDTASKPIVLVVDDEPDLIELVSLTLSRMNLAADSAGDLSAARAKLNERRFDLCLTDMRLPDGDGLDLVGSIQEVHPDVPVAVITAHGNVESAVRALKLGAFDFVSKPLDLGVLRKLVGSAIKLGVAIDEQTAATLRGPRLLGGSAVMEQLREMIGRVSRSQAPVHICGESGTGKELVARMIHESGGRRGGPFVAVNCGAIPTELMESELFGHKRGSFTGAVADKKGLVQSAEGGTLFWDEVPDLPLHMQVKLLRVVQEKTVRVVGDSREERVDVRILSATHKNLSDLVSQGQFREDLFYRINVIELRVPALRERASD